MDQQPKSSDSFLTSHQQQQQNQPTYTYKQQLTMSFTATTQNKQQSFPLKLYNVLQSTCELDSSHVISWLDHGRAFRLHDEKKFMEMVAETGIFRSTKLRSFTRQLNLWGFRRWDRLLHRVFCCSCSAFGWDTDIVIVQRRCRRLLTHLLPFVIQLQHPIRHHTKLLNVVPQALPPRRSFRYHPAYDSYQDQNRIQHRRR